MHGFPPFRLIKHTKQLLEENEEKLCIKVLQTLREMMTKDRGYGEKVLHFIFMFKPGFAVKVGWLEIHLRSGKVCDGLTFYFKAIYPAPEIVKTCDCLF